MRPDRFLTPAAVESLRSNAPLPRRPVFDAFTRAMDLIVATLVLVLVSPIMLAIAAVVLFQDRGPILYRQERLGVRGQPFAIFKFRTMRVGAEREGAGLRSVRNDERVTRAGKLLREFHLDELPQLFNVLRGEMALVGPRPALVFHKDYYEDWELPRLEITPGMTGLSQVAGGNALNWDERIIIDLHYVRRRNLGLYAWILILTFGQLFVRKGIYGREGMVKGWTRPLPEWYKDDTDSREEPGA